ncbi:hypothetical protein [Actinopolyspora mortivallis]|uniref:Uncharacterized protein n=1 Tax=Actinopolyspora mortivallis TaxID=33906 RepID=A0A2T0GW49_ACTMO|nr:hypothetical protein [Actinopolyspora mortivallis]PRW63338.1 hypothetical protein CEP50_11005 [Actinopolyspora mortivallis]
MRRGLPSDSSLRCELDETQRHHVYGNGITGLPEISELINAPARNNVDTWVLLAMHRLDEVRYGTRETPLRTLILLSPGHEPTAVPKGVTLLSADEQIVVPRDWKPLTAGRRSVDTTSEAVSRPRSPFPEEPSQKLGGAEQDRHT